MQQCIVSGFGDLAMDREAAKFIRTNTVWLKQCKSGLHQVAMSDDFNNVYSIPKSNITLVAPGRTLSSKEIQERIRLFNKVVPYDWSIFNDVPEHQSVDIMYPFVMKPLSPAMYGQSS